MTNHPHRSKQQQARHTPGPWFYRPQRAGMPGYIDVGDREICHMPFGQPTHTAEIDANARLIAAAPELLTALTGLLDTFESIDDGENENHPSFVAARAAIAKAEGR